MTQEELKEALEEAHKQFTRMETQAGSLRQAQNILNNRAQTWRSVASRETGNYDSILKGDIILAKLSSLASNSLEEAFVLSIIIQDYLEVGKLPDKHLEACKKELDKSHIYTNDYAKEIKKLENEVGIHYISEQG